METRCMQLRVLEKHALVIFYLRHAYVEGNCLFQEYWSGNDNFSFGEENKQRVVKTIVAKMNHSSYC